jgi:hypothetical protein
MYTALAEETSMLNRVKVAQELERIVENLFPERSDDYAAVRAVWNAVADDPLFAHRIHGVFYPGSVPTWTGTLHDQFSVAQEPEQYCVLGMDGSQIYPDRHEGAACFLINVGAVHLHYGIGGQAVQFFSEPMLFSGYEEDAMILHESPQELVNCRRQELEFQVGVEHAKKMKAVCCFGEPSLYMCDGSLIFWHLESKSPEAKQRFLTCYLTSLQQLYEDRVLCAGYISLTKSKELTNVVRLAISEFAAELHLESLAQQFPWPVLDRMVDATIVQFFLELFHRTIVFKNHAPISKNYPPHLHPHFFYMHVGHEIARIEIPAWIAGSAELIETVSMIILDQCRKGDGYPVALAEAHEQAVVKGPDREFFYQLVQRAGIERYRQPHYSQKIRNKRGMRV